MGIIGIGTDVVDIARFRASLERTPGLRTRLFTPAELAYADQAVDPTERLAARFAAKEAVLKALQSGLGAARMRDIEVERAESGAPTLQLHDTAATLAADHRATTWHLSLSHSDLIAQAFVIAEGG